jgi:hypothetical protein
MASESKDFVVRFVSDTSKWKPKINQVQQDMKKLNSSSVGVAANMKKMGSATVAASSTMGTLGSKIGGLAGGMVSWLPMLAKYALYIGLIIGAYKALKFFAKAGVEAEQIIMKLTAVMGSNSKALEMYHKLETRAGALGVTVSDLSAAAIKGFSYGVDITKKGIYGIKGDILTLATGMARFAGGTVSDAISGIMRGQSRQLRIYGGVAIEAAKTASKYFTVGSAGFKIKLIQELAKVPMYFKLAEDYANTTSGMWERIKNYSRQFVTNVSGAAEDSTKITFWSQLTGTLRDITDWFGEFVNNTSSWASEFGSVLGESFSAVWELIKALMSALMPSITAALAILLPAIKYTLMAIKIVANILSWVFGKMNAVYMAAYRFFDSILGITSGMKTIGTNIENFFIKIQMMGAFFNFWWDGVMEAIDPFLEKVKAIFLAIYNFMAPIIQASYGLVGSAAKSLVTGDSKPLANWASRAIQHDIDWLKDKLGFGGGSTVNNSNSVSTVDNSSTTTINNGGPSPQAKWHIRNQFDVSGGGMGR